MGGLAVVGGHSLLGGGLEHSGFPPHARRRPAHGTAGPVIVLDAGDYLVLQRHGLDSYRPPHRVDHVANLSALAAAGCDRVLALGSVGALRPELPVGSVVAPHDFIALDQAPINVHDDARDHVVPGFTPAWRSRIVDAWRAEADSPLVEQGVYWQTNGPRFETAAEVRLLAGFADIVGMTVASECVAANELGLAYAAVCIVDNLANGLDDAPLRSETFEAGKVANAARLADTIAAVAATLAS